MVHVRSPAILARLQWVVETTARRRSTQRSARWRRASPPRSGGVVDPTQWVSFDAYVSLSAAIDARYGKGDFALCRELGRYSARVNLPTLYRIFYQFGSVRFILSKATAVWSEHYDSGHASARDVGPKEVAILVEDFATPHVVLCLSVLGWI